MFSPWKSTSNKTPQDATNKQLKLYYFRGSPPRAQELNKSSPLFGSQQRQRWRDHQEAAPLLIPSLSSAEVSHIGHALTNPTLRLFLLVLFLSHMFVCLSNVASGFGLPRTFFLLNCLKDLLFFCCCLGASFRVFAVCKYWLHFGMAVCLLLLLLLRLWFMQLIVVEEFGQQHIFVRIP